MHMSAPAINDAVTLSGEDAANVIRLQNARIKQLEGWLQEAQHATPKEVVQRVAEVIKYLRMHSVVLLYTGHGPADALANRIEDAAAVAALGQAWNLDNAPLPLTVIEQVRAATLGGMNRF